eukprot:CAMPEP_0182531058 /NCGR_PEP_ID=MMETSP1323-20130603/7681_1 /TAXON_ID=236787 /ORGANISM="Florenciella parvula, Strain RCC1693" /LENGTH=52 /DNA_ID=CAMNT_0024740521 /DNA_START=214 /DNA_END=368 /DNA_ORIENTATION=+
MAPAQRSAALYHLPAHVAANDNVAAEDGALAPKLVDGERDDGGGHRELHRGG